MAEPRDPIAAVTHPAPYPYYERLAAREPFVRDEALGTWVASGEDAVRAVLASDACGVRPRDEPVPRALVGTAAGDFFGRLARMRDGEAHRAVRPPIDAEIARTPAGAIGSISDVCARALVAEIGDPDAAAVRVTELAFALPIHAVGRWLGVTQVAGLVSLVDDLVLAFRPGAAPDRVARGARAAEALLARLEVDGGRRMDRANAVGLLVQAYEATAGLLGNTLVALGRDAALGARARDDARALASIVADVGHADPAVQNTRRFALRGVTLCGQTLREGDPVLVVLAASRGRSLPFGAGAHECPGRSIATAIATAGVRAILGAGIDPARLVAAMRYRPSVNTRVPLFGERASQTL